jgi:signal transduction histidine kinase/CheY-like chemotaxis protein/methyl-accepting chemotaxis protein/CHASE3 domain sensor protein
MKFFNNLKVGSKIFFGFLIILMVMGVMGGVAIFQFVKIDTTVTDLADNLAKDQHLSDQMVARILLARFYANKYIRGHKPEDLARFKQEFAHFEKLLAEAGQEITKDERVKMLGDIKAGVQDYGEKFAQVVQVMDKRQQLLAEVLNVQGPLADLKLEQLRKSAFQAEDAIASFYAGHAQRALLLMRLDAFKYLEEGDPQWLEKFEERYHEAQAAFKKLDEELQDPTRRKLAQVARIAVDKYHHGFTSLQADYAKQNQMIETQLNVIGPQVRKTSTQMSTSVTTDFEATNEKTHALIDHTLWQLLITMLVGLVVGIGFGFFISRSITVPLATVIEMSNKMAAGDMNQMVDVQSRDKINQITLRLDEIGNIGRAYDVLANNFKAVIDDIVLVSQGLVVGDLRVSPQATYQGDFVKIKEALETGWSNLRLVIEDIVQISQGLVEGKQRVTAQAEYQGDFLPIKESLESASINLMATNAKNKAQDWLKTGQTQISVQMSGEQDMIQLAKNIITFLATYLEMPIGMFYLLEEAKEDKIACLKLIASYAYTHRKGVNCEFVLGEGIVGQAALEQKAIFMTKVPDDYYVRIHSGLGQALPRTVIVHPFMYENALKGVIELASFKTVTDLQREFLAQIMPSIGIAVNTAESRSRLQSLLQKSQKQTEELQSQAEELQTQQEELRHTNDELEERTKDLERQKDDVRKKNKALEKTQSEMEKAKKAIETKAKELELASKYKSEFLANMSHELRTPLNSLLILAQLLVDNKTGNLNDKQVEYAQTIHSAGSDLLTLINEILDLSKVEAGKIEVNVEKVSLNDLVATVDQKFRHVAQDKGLDFHLTVADDLPTTLNTDEQRLKQIINNLLSNAFKFTKAGEIRLAIQYPDNREEIAAMGLDSAKTIVISVADTGIGIPQDKQMLIFEAFQQVDGTTSRSYGGTGLGLSISRQLARLLGGELKLYSEEGKGSTFTLYLPETLSSVPAKASTPQPSVLTEASTDQPLVLQAEASTAQPSGVEPSYDSPVADDRKSLTAADKSLLVIEDDRHFSTILLNLAREKDFKCIIAEDGKTGLQLAEEYHPSAIILDIGLPKMDGWTVMERLKDNPDTRHIPVHFMSADDQGLEAKQMGAIGYLLKPISMTELGEAFKKIEGFITKTIKNTLVLVDNEPRKQEILKIVGGENIKTTTVATITGATQEFQMTQFDCVIIDVDVEQQSGLKAIEQLQSEHNFSQIPVIIYAGRELTPEEDRILQQCTDNLTVKAVRSPERLLDEVALFLHKIETRLPGDKQQLLQMVHDKEAILAYKKVLIVDDDMRNSYALTTVLEDKEMQVVIAETGKEALQKLEQHEDISIVLMDIMMPEMDGYEALREIRKQYRYQKLPIIALTAKAMKGDKVKCIEAGASDYLAKPVDTDKLISLMRVWLYR